MAHRDLDALIREARLGEAPTEHVQQRLREALDRRIASGDAGPEIDPLLPDRAARLGVGSAGMTLIAGSLVLGALTLYALAGRGPDDPRPELPSAVETSAVESSAVESSAGPRAAAEGLAKVPPTSAVPVRSASEEPVRDVAVEAPQPPRSRPRSIRPGAERRALAQIEHALREGRFVQALRLTDEQDRAFPRGALGEERAAARVLALCGAGKSAEARQLAADFVAQHPRSPLRARVLESCKSTEKNGAP